ncbi:methionine ABC transporter ATP-binding protein [Paenibacillus rigui]|uniref:ABC transporter n=1 Tax=Paenibacillus rigui TaxID=554312 RepID=A0A229UU17_9BACL|nr:ATP-binding cassette domain-containing protein [Paenibacillus rigui]OXM86751.1 ABC transporter [Paenibacillus rigui]
MITLKHIHKTYTTDEGVVHAVRDVSLEIEKGDIYGIIGFSGAGKSSLMRTINLLERPDSGHVFVDGKELSRLSKKELRRERHSIGMVFQHFNLLNNRTVYGNVALALELAGVPKSQHRQRIEECLDILEISEKSNVYPVKLSGGQKQRVAIARAIANRPKVLLCDEPTSSIDPQMTESILRYLKQINRQLGITIVIVTHEMDVINSICNKVAVMENGIIVENFILKDPAFVPTSRIAKFLLKRENFYFSVEEEKYA